MISENIIMACDLFTHGPCHGRLLEFPGHFQRCAGHVNLHHAWMASVREQETALDLVDWIDRLPPALLASIIERELPHDTWPLR